MLTFYILEILKAMTSHLIVDDKDTTVCVIFSKLSIVSKE